MQRANIPQTRAFVTTGFGIPRLVYELWAKGAGREARNESEPLTYVHTPCCSINKDADPFGVYAFQTKLVIRRNMSPDLMEDGLLCCLRPKDAMTVVEKYRVSLRTGGAFVS